MTVTVRLFARARELAGTGMLAVELPTDSTLGDLRRHLAQSHPKLGPLLERSALAMDDEFADDGVTLHDGADVALLPPVSGG